MKTEQAQVLEFMVNAQQHIPASPTLPAMQVRISRLRWIAEELCELANAWGVEIEVYNRGRTTGNFMASPMPPELCFTDEVEALTEAYDASLDLIVFSVGNGVAMGLDLESGWQCVHASNMAKFATGGYKREDGKWMKPPNWQPPRLRPIVEAQIAQAKDQPSLPGT